MSAIAIAVVLFLAVCAHTSHGDCTESEDERLGCFGWWKWDTPKFCQQRGCCASPELKGKWCFYPNPRAAIKTVHVVQGCHLDVGFANTAQNIVNEWFDEHLPKAAAVGAQLAQLNTSAQLHFTAPAWIVSLYLDCPAELPLHCPNATARATIMHAIKMGWITWHAYPFNGAPAVTANAQLKWSSWTRG